jgi:hypothetical protein
MANPGCTVSRPSSDRSEYRIELVCREIGVRSDRLELKHQFKSASMVASGAVCVADGH